MLRPRPLALALFLVALATRLAAANPPTVSHEGREYVDARVLAATLGGKIESTPERAYMRVGKQLVVFTRDWARVEVDGRPVVLDAPVRLAGDRWLVPAVFLRQVAPQIAAKPASPPVTPPPAAAPRASSADPASSGAASASPGPAFAAGAVASAAPVPPAPPAELRLEDLRLRSYPTFTRVVLETSAPVRYRVEPGAGKEARVRLIALGAEARVDTIRDGLLDEVHLEPVGDDVILRVTFPGGAVEPRATALSDPPRLLLDFARPSEPGPRPSGAAPGLLRTVVLDAGHGGHDSGAVGPTGLQEKDLVLDVTRRVAALVEARLPGVKVRLSRSGDHFVPLRERTSFANRERADLFVSIHANAARESASEGVETFFLSSEATDSAARQVASVENGVVKLERVNGRGGRPDVVKSILWDLAQSDFQQESSRLAEVLQDSMTQSLRISNRGVKQAGFYVLGGAAMPAVLVEIGFVTSPREERRLRDARYRDEIAQAIFAGLAEYKRDLEGRAPRAASR